MKFEEYVWGRGVEHDSLMESTVVDRLRLGHTWGSESAARNPNMGYLNKPDYHKDGDKLYRVTVEELRDPVHPEFEKGFREAYNAALQYVNDNSYTATLIKDRAEKLGIDLTK